jgi:energy-coupling factor transporter transmembrane protein EcfT
MPGDARADRAWHPGAKVVSVLALALGLVAGGEAALLATAALTAVLLVRSPGAGKGWLGLLRRLRWVFLFIVLLHGWLTPGPPLLPALGGGSPSVAGLRFGAELAGVVAVMAALVAALTRTTPSAELAGGLAWALRPLGRLGVDVDRFGRLLAWTVDRVEPVRQEAGAVRDALRLRRPEGRGVGERLRFEAAAARAILRRAREAADRNAEALYLRGGGIVHPLSPPAAIEWAGMVTAAGWAAVWTIWA